MLMSQTITASEVCAALAELDQHGGFTTRDLAYWTEAGELPDPVAFGTEAIYNRAEFDAWLRSCTTYEWPATQAQRDNVHARVAWRKRHLGQ
jgi:hypothetical protein